MAMTRNEKTGNLGTGRNYYNWNSCQKDKYDYARNDYSSYEDKDKSSEITDTRIITKNLVYVIGLSSRIAHREILMKKEYFGQYGTILKVVVNNHKAYNQNNPKGPSYSAYVTYAKPFEASLAILSLDNVTVDEHLVRASFGTTKYCSFFLKKIECTNKECVFLHKVADKNDIISREELNGNKNIFLEQQLYAMKIADIFDSEVKKKINNMNINKKYKSVLPSPEMIYNKDIVRENDPNYLKNSYPYKENSSYNKGFINSGKKKYYEDNNREYSNTVTTSIIDSNMNLNKLTIPKYTAETTSTSSKEDITYTNYANLNEEKSEVAKFFLFQNKEQSRFFNKKPQSDTPIEVPQFILNLLLKKANNFLLAKNLKKFKIEENIFKDKFLQKEYTNKSDWAQFILEEKNKLTLLDEIIEEDDQDLKDDFDKINNLVLGRIDKMNKDKKNK